MTRLGFWLLRRNRLRVNMSCPHSEFVPGRYSLRDGQLTVWSCSPCGTRVTLTVEP